MIPLTEDEAVRRARNYAEQLLHDASLRNMDGEELFIAFTEVCASKNADLAGKILVALNRVVMSRLIVPAIGKENEPEKSRKSQ